MNARPANNCGRLELAASEGAYVRSSRLILLVAAIGLLYWVYQQSCRHGGWLWDDDLYVFQNASLRSANGLLQNWIHPAGLNYFPVMATVQWLQWHLWGSNPAGYRWTNLILHFGSAILVWRLFSKLGFPMAWLAGVIFALHPIGVESVAWISELKNTLSLVALLSAMCFYVDFENERHRGHLPLARRRYGASIACFAIAMLCKSTVAMLPPTILLFAWFRRGRLQKADLGAALPFFGISAVLGLVTIHFEHARSMHGLRLGSAEFLERLAAAGISAQFYLSKCLFPVDQLPTYPRWHFAHLSPIHFLPWFVLFVPAFWLSCTTIPWRRHALFGLAFFLINLLPVLGLVPMAYQWISWVADHFAYISLVGYAGLVAGGIARLMTLMPRNYALALSFTIVAAYAVESQAYAAIFVDRQSLWRYTLARFPESWAAHNDTGNLLLAENRLPEAIRELNLALKYEPDAPSAHNNLGSALSKIGRPDLAIAEFKTSLALGADLPEVHYNLALALARVKHAPDAIVQYQTALVLDPAMAKAYVNLGALLAQGGSVSAAVDDFRKAISFDASDPLAHFNLALAMATQKQWAEAVREFQMVAHLEPDYPGLHPNLGSALFELGRYHEAIGEYELASRASPSDPDLHYNLGVAFQAVGMSADASIEFATANRLLSASRPSQ